MNRTHKPSHTVTRMRRSLILVGLLLIGILASTATAEPGWLFHPKYGTVPVWTSELFVEEGEALLAAGITTPAARYIACVVSQETAVMILPGGWKTHRIVVTAGKHKGCIGNVKYVALEPLK
jgi:hypothetical protein